MKRKTAVLNRALGIAPASEADAGPTPESKPVPSFDGGVRGPAPVAPESHGEWLLRIIRRAVAAPSDWPWPHG